MSTKNPENFPSNPLDTIATQKNEKARRMTRRSFLKGSAFFVGGLIAGSLGEMTNTPLSRIEEAEQKRDAYEGVLADIKRRKTDLEEQAIRLASQDPSKAAEIIRSQDYVSVSTDNVLAEAETRELEEAVSKLGGKKLLLFAKYFTYVVSYLAMCKGFEQLWGIRSLFNENSTSIKNAKIDADKALDGDSPQKLYLSALSAQISSPGSYAHYSRESLHANAIAQGIDRWRQDPEGRIMHSGGDFLHISVPGFLPEKFKYTIYNIALSHRGITPERFRINMFHNRTGRSLSANINPVWAEIGDEGGTQVTLPYLYGDTERYKEGNPSPQHLEIDKLTLILEAYQASALACRASSEDRFLYPLQFVSETMRSSLATVWWDYQSQTRSMLNQYSLSFLNLEKWFEGYRVIHEVDIISALASVREQSPSAIEEADKRLRFIRDSVYDVIGLKTLQPANS